MCTSLHLHVSIATAQSLEISVAQAASQGLEALLLHQRLAVDEHRDAQEHHHEADHRSSAERP